jgi:hypothetical protein
VAVLNVTFIRADIVVLKGREILGRKELAGKPVAFLNFYILAQRSTKLKTKSVRATTKF